MEKMSARTYILKNPNATAAQIVKATGVKRNTAYKIKYLTRKELASGVDLSSLRKRRGRPPKAKLIDLSAQPVFMATSNKSVSDMVNHPPHYKVGGIETIDFIEAKKLNYNLGNVVKYITRADHKGARKQDLEKARWYLDREIKSLT